MELKRHIRSIPDFPKPGILFYDITTLLKNKKAFKAAVQSIAARFKDKKIDAVVAIESRGFILGGALAYKLGVSFVPVRKKGKLPWKTCSASYNLEYGTDTLEMHEDAIRANDRILVVDDLLATGGTMEAVLKLINGLKGKVVGIAFLIELATLGGRKKLKGYSVSSLVTY